MTLCSRSRRLILALLLGCSPAPAWSEAKAETPPQSLWKPLGGTAAAERIEIEGHQVHRLPCNFAETSIERAAWDRSVRLDLSTARGLVFHFFCGKPGPAAAFTAYLHSGGGWYSLAFEVNETDAWNRIVFDKLRASPEGNPGGWGNIDRIRIAVWRGGGASTECYITGLGRLDSEGGLLLLGGDWAKRRVPAEAGAIASAARRVAGHLDALGLPFVAVSDLDLKRAHLDGKGVAILPYNPVMPEAVSEALSDFLDSGGKLIAFYKLPAALLRAAGLESGTYEAAAYPGQFASIRPAGAALEGMPPETAQLSWNIQDMRPAPGGRIAAYWYDRHGEDTGRPAIVVSKTCVFMSHVLLGDGHWNKQRLVLAMAGHFDPESWRLAARHRIGELERNGRFREFLEGANRGPGRGAAEAAAAMTARAREQLTGGEYLAALDSAGAALEKSRDAYSLAQKPQEGEHRAFWCHDARGVPPWTWDESIERLAENGFTAILANMLWAGAAFCETGVLPIAPEVRRSGDLLAQCLAACKSHGLACHVWKVCWKLGPHAPRDFARRMKEAGRTQVRFDGSPEDGWLCPSHPENRELEIAVLLDTVGRYDIDGIHLDYIRYPDRRTCFCAGCRKRFDAHIGKKAEGWPAAVLAQPELKAQWLDFRRAQITGLLEELRPRLRALKPGLLLSAAVFPAWPQARDTIAQDWEAWCREGLLDFVCPMSYTPNSARFRWLAERQLEWAGPVPCYPGIGLSTWPPGGATFELLEQIKVTRELGTGGFTVFNYGAREMDEILPRCGMGITRRAEPPRDASPKAPVP